MDETEEIKQSKFNAGVAQLYRLDNLWREANMYSTGGQLGKWNWILDCVWRELAIMDEKTIKKFWRYNKEIVLSRRKNQKGSLNYWLSEKERFLRTLQDNSGKGTAFRESSGDYMDN